MESQFAILLLIVPGYIARKIYRHTNDVRDDLSTFEETLYCLVNSGVISLLAIIILIASFIPCNSISSLSTVDLKDMFTQLTFIALYMCIVLAISVMVGLSTYRLNALYTDLINWIRSKKEKNLITINQSIFDEYFNDGIYQHYVEIYKDDKFICRGRLNTNVEKYKELGVEPCEEGIRELMVALKMTTPRLKKFYYDTKSGLLIKEYDFPDIKNG